MNNHQLESVLAETLVGILTVLLLVVFATSTKLATMFWPDLKPHLLQAIAGLLK